MIEVVKNFETVRKQWLHAETELKKYKELLVKSDVAKAALEVKLKHARNQLDVEMKKRYKIEGDYQYLVSGRRLSGWTAGDADITSCLDSQQRQMQLMCDILVHDSKSSACLNEEQKSLLAAFEQRGANVTVHRSSKRYLLRCLEVFQNSHLTHFKGFSTCLESSVFFLPSGCL